jgi:sialidase-1
MEHGSSSIDRDDSDDESDAPDLILVDGGNGAGDTDADGASASASASASAFDVDVFTAGVGEGAEGCFRIPTILNSNGTLLVFVERRFVSCKDESPHSIELRRSTDGGHSWLPQQSLDAVGPAVMKNGNAANGTVSNGAAVVDETTGTIFFAYRRAVVTPLAFWTHIVSSTDAGQSWSQPMNAGLNRTGTSPGQGSGVQLASGRLVLPNNGGGAIVSDDHGKTCECERSGEPAMRAPPHAPVLAARIDLLLTD